MSDSKTNGPLSPLERSGKIQIIRNKNKQMVDLNTRLIAIHKSESAGAIILNPDKINSLLQSKKDTPSKPKGISRSNRKKKEEVKQIFETSDRISYNFNKIDPFCTTTKKSIAESIREAHKLNGSKQPERKFIKANNYYLHNYMMGNGGPKNSLLRFRLDEILKEK